MVTRSRRKAGFQGGQGTWKGVVVAQEWLVDRSPCYNTGPLCIVVITAALR